MSVASAGPDRSASSLVESEILACIARSGPIPFSTYMELALYAENGGYYERGRAAIGPAGDFYTASDLGSAFGEMLATQIAECARLLGDGPFDLVELGAGKGTMAADLLAALRDRHAGLYRRLVYWVVDRSRAMRDEQQEALAEHLASGKVRWADGPEATRDGGIVGCVVANEFYDALPVRIVTREAGALLERRVGLVGDPPGPGFVDLPCSDAELDLYASSYALAPVDGVVAEAGLAARAYAWRVASAIRQGFQIVIDYGDRAERLYDPDLRPAGTLASYHRHRLVDDPFVRIGEQDMTAHVNFSAIEDAGRAAGLASLGLTTQDRFLISLGLAERIAALASSREPAAIRRRLAMMGLIHPEVMGRIFRVLIQAKGVRAPDLTGLRDPFSGARAGEAGDGGDAKAETRGAGV